MPYGWEGNRRSGVALAVLHKPKRFIYLRAQGPWKGDKHPTYTPLRGMAHFTFYLYYNQSYVADRHADLTLPHESVSFHRNSNDRICFSTRHAPIIVNTDAKLVKVY